MSAVAALTSQPTLCAFQPVIPYQREVCDLVRDFDYGTGNLEILLSGSFGSAKSTLMAHLVVRHCIEFKGARVCLGRRAMPDLKRTLWREVLDHISVDMREGRHYIVNRQSMTITFRNGSEIICASWADGRYKRFRSLKLSMLAVEEMVENDADDEEAYKELRARLRRLPHVPQNLAIGATNPDSPSHWVHRYFIDAQRATAPLPHPTRRVFYSNTEDNPFIDRTYVAALKEDLSPREADRYLRGLWIELRTSFIYYAYDSAKDYRPTLAYKVDPEHPVHLSFDFNIALGKPMSAVLFQYIDDHFHIFAESVIEGARTAEVIEDFDARELLPRELGSPPRRLAYELNGDAAGKHKDTRSSRSDYDIIEHELHARGIVFIRNVPLANPPVRTRHNRVNAYCLNDAGKRRITVYKGCETVDEGLRLTALKKGAGYIEDDSKAFQHVTTAVGYGILATLSRQTRRKQGTVQL